jgi:hypothetical protein
MTLEINEINVQISVGSSSHPSGLSSSSPLHPASDPPVLTADLVDQLVQRCVRDVLRYLRMKEQR